MERREKLEHAVKERERVRLDAVQKKWNRREENEFLRVLTGYGVDLQQGTSVPTPDWMRFKAMAKLDKKSDESLSDYYKVFIAMCKRQAGVRLNDDEKGLEGIIDDISEDHARLVLDRLELLSKLREIVRHTRLDERLKLCSNNFDTPDWWESGKHDKELIRAVLKHGLYRSEYYIFNDPEFTYNKSERLFVEEIESHLLKAQMAEAEDLDNKERIIKLEKGDSTMQIEKVKKEETADAELASKPVEVKAEIIAPVIEEIVIKDDDSDIETDAATPVTASSPKPKSVSDTDEVAEIKEEDSPVKSPTSDETEQKVQSPATEEKDTKESIEDEESAEKKDEKEIEKANSSDDDVEMISDSKSEVAEVEKVKTEVKETEVKAVEEVDISAEEEVKIKEEDEILEGKGDPDDDEVMKEKEKAVEEECKKQAAELKARFPDLEVIQPLVKVKAAEIKDVKGK